MFYLELTTGLRRGELLALLWTDLDIEARTISITKQVNRINGTGDQSAEDAELRPDAGNPAVSGGPAGRRASETPKQSVYVPFA